MLKGRRATTHWASFHLLPLFGAIPVNQRVVVDGDMVFAAGVTAGIGGAQRVAADLRGDENAPGHPAADGVRTEPPFNSGTPETAPPAILGRAARSVRDLAARRGQTARRMATRLGTAAGTPSERQATGPARG